MTMSKKNKKRKKQLTTQELFAKIDAEMEFLFRGMSGIHDDFRGPVKEYNEAYEMLRKNAARCKCKDDHVKE